MSNYIKAETSMLPVKGSPVNNKVETVTFLGNDNMNAVAGIGGALTYFKGEFKKKNKKEDKSIHRVEAKVVNLSSNPLGNQATGYLSAEIKGEDSQADVKIQTYLLAELSNRTNSISNDFVFINVSGENKKIITQQFNSEIQVVEPILRGFNINYKNDHWIKRFTATQKNVAYNNSSAIFTSVVDAEMSDDSGHTGGGKLYTTLVGSKNSTPSWEKKTWNPKDGEITVQSSGDSPLEEAYVFAQGVFMKFTGGNDHKIKKITIDTGNDNLHITTNEQNKDGNGYNWGVTFKPNLDMKDDSGNSESKGNSYIDLLVIFVPSQTL